MSLSYCTLSTKEKTKQWMAFYMRMPSISSNAPPVIISQGWVNLHISWSHSTWTVMCDSIQSQDLGADSGKMIYSQGTKKTCKQLQVSLRGKKGLTGTRRKKLAKHKELLLEARQVSGKSVAETERWHVNRVTPERVWQWLKSGGGWLRGIRNRWVEWGTAGKLPLS